jgi:hypothetical protein
MKKSKKASTISAAFTLKIDISSLRCLSGALAEQILLPTLRLSSLLRCTR